MGNTNNDNRLPPNQLHAALAWCLPHIASQCSRSGCLSRAGHRQLEKMGLPWHPWSCPGTLFGMLERATKSKTSKLNYFAPNPLRLQTSQTDLNSPCIKGSPDHGPMETQMLSRNVLSRGRRSEAWRLCLRSLYTHTGKLGLG